jgi:hypothetical protein
MSVSGLTDLRDTSHFYDWGLFLPLCKSSGLSMNCIGANKPLTVIVKHGDLPVMVLSPRIFSE